jgi:MFS family permease
LKKTYIKQGRTKRQDRSIIIGMGNGALWCLTPTMTSEYYGMKYFGRNWGFIMFISGLGGLAVQEVYGWIYEMAIPYK